jgi:hypothetical protein
MNPTAKLLNDDPISGFITVFIEGKQYTINASNPAFPNALKAYKESDWQGLVDSIHPANKLHRLYFQYENIEVKDGNVYIDGDAVTSIVAERVLNALAGDVDAVHIFKFMTRLQLNPSKRAVDELYTFLEHKNLPITDSGTFLAYKAVRSDYSDKHTGTFFNTVGSVLTMPRNKVDDDKNAPCSYGFHAGTLEYASDFANHYDKMVVVEIDPADVVSIPTDCNFQKLRTCRYKVVAEYEKPLVEDKYTSNFETENDVYVEGKWQPRTYEMLTVDGNTYKLHTVDDEEYYLNETDSCDYCESDYCECESEEDEDDEDEDDGQLTLDLDGTLLDYWKTERFHYINMLAFLYGHQRPAVANALKNFYKDVDDQHMINPEFRILHQFTSEDDVFKIYQAYSKL